MELKLLTGAVLDVRKWKLADMDALLKSSGRGFLPALLRVFTDCTSQVLEPGVYSNFSWENVYEGDLYDALWQWRSFSLRDEYEFTLTCPQCHRRMDLAKNVSEVVRRRPSEYLLSHLREGRNRVPIEFSCGQFTLLIPTAAEAQALLNTADRKASSIRQTGGPTDTSDAGLLRAMRMRLLAVTTTDGTTLEGAKLDHWLEEIDLDVGSEILALIEENSFGVDTAAEFSCGNCGNVFSGDIPMQKSFFLAKRGRP